MGNVVTRLGPVPNMHNLTWFLVCDNAMIGSPALPKDARNFNGLIGYTTLRTSRTFGGVFGIHAGLPVWDALDSQGSPPPHLPSRLNATRHVTLSLVRTLSNGSSCQRLSLWPGSFGPSYTFHVV